MARFAHKTKKTTTGQQLANREDATTNHAGGLAFKTSSEMELYLRACSSFIADSYYRSGSQELTELREIIAKCDRQFVLQLADYVRNEMNLRTMPLVLLAEASQLGDPKGDKSDVRRAVRRVVQRADEPMELISYYIQAIGKGTKSKLPNALKKGINDYIETLDEYKLGKYWRGGRSTKAAVTAKDVLRICHTASRKGKAHELSQLTFTDRIPIARTHESFISEKGSTAEAWNEISADMGMMALLKNLRNFEKKGAEKAIQTAVEAFSTEERVRKSRILPFRYYTARKEVSDARLREALDTAIELSVANLPKMEGSTAIFVDNSGSMQIPISAKSKVVRNEIAAVMGALALHMTEGQVLLGAFGQHYATAKVSRRDSVLTNAAAVQNLYVGHSTEAWKSLKHLIDNEIVCDRVFIFSDMQCYNQGWGVDSQLAPYWKQYRKQVNPNAVMYSVDLASYGMSQFPEDDPSVVLVAGWSERIFDLCAAYEGRANALDVIRQRPV